MNSNEQIFLCDLIVYVLLTFGNPPAAFQIPKGLEPTDCHSVEHEIHDHSDREYCCGSGFIFLLTVPLWGGETT